ncbi:hypothetical protein GF406_14160 [candidate division KSB1 bacterium]|nr:hypothetical protein [candidate division KSB1 bacterium]
MSRIGFYDKIKFIETLEETDNLSSESIDAIINALHKNRSLMIYFVNNIKNVKFVKQLAQRNFFINFPESIEGEERINYQGWIEGNLLNRMAEKIPEVVLEVIGKAKTKNLNVYTSLLAASLKVDIEKVHNVWPTMIEWLNNNSWHNYPRYYIDLAIKLISNGYFEDTMALLDIILKPVAPKRKSVEQEYLKDCAISRFDFFKYERYENTNIFTICKLLIDNKQFKLIKLLENLFNEAILIEKDISASDYVDTGYWRKAIEDHSQNIIKEYKNFLLDLLRDSLEQAINSDENSIVKRVQIYLFKSDPIYKRLGVHLIRISKDRHLEIAEEILAKYEMYDDDYLHHEIFLLLRDCYPVFEEQFQEKVLSIIKLGPKSENLEKYLKYISENHPDDDLDEAANEYSNRWIRARLFMIKDHLEGENLLLWNKLSEGVNFEKYHPEFRHFTSAGGFVAHIAPISEKEWKGMTVLQKVDFLISWSGEKEQDFSLKRVCPEGLAKLFKEDLKKEWDTYKTEILRLINNSPFPCYSFEIVELICETIAALKKDTKKEDLPFTDIDYNFILDILSSSISKWQNDFTSDGHETGYGRSVCTRSLNVISELSQYIDHKREKLKDDQFLRMRNILIDLCDNIDPTQKEDDPQDERFKNYYDPVTTSINHVRPIALRELLRYAVARSNILGLKKKRWEEEVENKVTAMLKDKAFSVRSVFGECWAWICHLDNDWAGNHHTDIFPKDYENRYFIAAWDGYIIHKYYIDDPRYDLMRPLYIHAIKNALKENMSQTHLEPDRRLAEHLIGFYQFDIEKLPTEDHDMQNPLAYLYSIKPNTITSHMVWSLWRRCKDIAEIDKKKEIWAKALVLWQYRLMSVNEENKNEFFGEEISWFINFLTIKELQVKSSEIEEILLGSIKYFKGGFRDNGLSELLEYLNITIEYDIEFSIKVLNKIFDIHGASWYFDKDEVEPILESAAKSSSLEVKKQAVYVVHKLGEYGHHWARDYLDRLRNV